MVIFGLINFEQMGTARLGIVDQANNDGSKQLIETLKKIDVIFAVKEIKKRGFTPFFTISSTINNTSISKKMTKKTQITTIAILCVIPLNL
jgi:hypothetical protein